MSDKKIINFPGVTTLNLDPDRVLQAAKEELTEVVILGYDKDGEEYFASSLADGADVLWHLKRAEGKLLSVVDKEFVDE